MNTQFKGAVIQTGTIQPLKSRGLDRKVRQSNENAVTMHFPGYKEKEAVLAAIAREVHVVDFLPCNMLIGNDVANPDPEGFISKRKITIRQCKYIVCPLRITPRGKPGEHRMVRTKRDMVFKSIPKDNSGPIQEAPRRPRLSFPGALQYRLLRISQWTEHSRKLSWIRIRCSLCIITVKPISICLPILTSSSPNGKATKEQQTRI